MNNDPGFDACVIGGGLAGLSAAILLRREGANVIMFEKEVYPVHKVCGEYISLESWDFLLSLGLPLKAWALPQMTRLSLTTSSGSTLAQPLPLGGFGISRFKLDRALMDLAITGGVRVEEKTKVTDVRFDNDQFHIEANGKWITAKTCCGSFGKRSSLDIKLNRSFILKKPDALNNYVGVKYHAVTDHPRDLISLHIFPGGYCGIAAIEDGLTNICYLTSAENLRQNQNSIPQLERNVLSHNPALKKILEAARFGHDKPAVISQISFEKKEQVMGHMLLTGDAAGLIAPLSGNGMSIALRSGAIAASAMCSFLQAGIDRETMEKTYENEWKKLFGRRMFSGRMLQRLFYHPWAGSALISAIKPFPFISRAIIHSTHGQRWSAQTLRK